MMSCKECGHTCTLTDFESFSGLCDHLYLDALTFIKRAKPPTLVDDRGDSAMQDCPRCRGLMRAEDFVDWTTNRTFGGWRCLSCGNVWDPGIADNRSSVHI